MYQNKGLPVEPSVLQHTRHPSNLREDYIEKSFGKNVLKNAYYTLEKIRKRELGSRKKKLLNSGPIHSNLVYGLAIRGSATKRRLNKVLYRQKRFLRKQIFNFRNIFHTVCGKGCSCHWWSCSFDDSLRGGVSNPTGHILPYFTSRGRKNEKAQKNFPLFLWWRLDQRLKKHDLFYLESLLFFFFPPSSLSRIWFNI